MKSGKVKIILASGNRIKKLEVLSYTEDGEEKKTEFKNGDKVFFNTESNKNSYTEYDENGNVLYAYSYESMMAYTEFKITFIDKYTKEEAAISMSLQMLGE